MLLLAACLAERAPEPDPDSNLNIDSSRATYNLRIAQIVQNNCATGSSCHGSGAGSLEMTNFAQTRAKAQSPAAQFYCRINHNAGCPPMPQGAPKLADSLLTYLDVWKLKNYPQ